jgi:hypothetical protein
MKVIRDKFKSHRNGWTTSFEQQYHNGMITVTIRTDAGEVYDRIRCDDYRNAMDYWRAFNGIAKAVRS